jgi:Protein of unknown function (DUF4012)
MTEALGSMLRAIGPPPRLVSHRRRHRGRHRRRRPRHFELLVAGAAFAICLWVGLTAISLIQAMYDSRSAMAAADSVRARLSSSNGILSKQSTATLARANDRFAALHDDLSTPVLTPLTWVPWLGIQIRSARAIATTADRVTAVGRQAATDVNAALARQHGPGPARVAIIRRMASIADSARASIAHLDPGPSKGLVSSLRHRHDQLVRDLAAAQDGLTRGAAASRAAADLLEGPGEYLLLAANNAEMRASSGIVLQAGFLTTLKGQMPLWLVRSVTDLPVHARKPGVAVPLQLEANWGSVLPGIWWQNLGVTPQFDVTGVVATNLWQGATEGHVDGVILVDIEALHQLLTATGPVTVEGTTVTQDNVVQLLMHDQYVTDSSQSVRRELLGSLARAAFQAVQDNKVDLKKLATAMARAADGRHIMIWSSVPSEEARWQTARVAGQLGPNDLDADLVNFAGNKLDWFLRETGNLQIRPRAHSTDVTVRMHLRNTTPPGEPQYVAGGGPGQHLDKGEYSALATVNVPGSAYGATINGSPAIVGPEGPTRLLATTVQVEPGQETDVTVHFSLPGRHGQLHVVPSARLPAVAWSGRARFLDSSPHTVSW